GSVDSGQIVVFSRDVGGGAVTQLKLKDPSEFFAKISDFNGRDQMDLLGFQLTAPASWGPNPNNIGGTLTLRGTIHDTTFPNVKLTFLDGTFVLGQTLKVGPDGSGGTLITDPPALTTTTDATTTTTDATVTPVAKTSTLTATKTTSSQTKATSATVTATPSS